MKKPICILNIAVLISVTAFAQKTPGEKIPAAVTSSFKTKFPDATKVKWEVENTNEYEAEFKLNGQEVSANFDQTGGWLETETELKTADLPLPVKVALEKDFAGFKIEEACKVESAKNGNSFEVEVEKGKEEFELLLSADGSVISKIRDEE